MNSMNSMTSLLCCFPRFAARPRALLRWASLAALGVTLLASVASTATARERKHGGGASSVSGAARSNNAHKLKPGPIIPSSPSSIDPHPADPTAEMEPGGIVFDAYDPDHVIRNGVDPAVSRRLFAWLERNTLRGGDAEETVLRAAGLSSALIDTMDGSNRLSPIDRRNLGEFALLSVLQVTAERHPELALASEGSLGAATGTSPVEQFCNCDRSGSTACGCTVAETGPGLCEYEVGCRTWRSTLCSAFNAEACVAKVAFRIIAASAD